MTTGSLMKVKSISECMGETFQDFETDFPQKVSLKIQNLTDSNSFFDLFSVYLKTIDR